MTCPSCYWDQGIVYCDVSPFDDCHCTTCIRQRWYDANPLEAARIEYEEAAELAWKAEERDDDDWPQLAAGAAGLYAAWSRLKRQADGDEASQPRGAPERSEGEG